MQSERGSSRTFMDPWLVIIAIALFILGFTVPLVDPDLPMHLAVGEWIARHHGVPFVEPFGWTRAGAPYFAYSWLAEVAFYCADRAFGARGLHIISGMLFAAAYVAIIVLGRAARWRPDVTRLVGLGNAVAVLAFTPSLRPQMLLFTVVPMAWTAGALLRDANTARQVAIALGIAFASAVLAANTHIFFAVTIAPAIVLLLAADRKMRVRVAQLALVVLAGWLCSPYGLIWWDVYRLYFSPNAFLGVGAPIAELVPGFISAPAIGLILAALPWLAVPRLPMRMRIPMALFWLAGLATFAVAAKGIVLWWLVCIPIAATAAELWPGASSGLLQRAPAVATVILCALLVLRDAASPLLWKLRNTEGDVTTRQLPSSVAPLADTLAAHLRPSAYGRILTVFNYGSFLTWRLPQLSASIDSRSIFPDSAAYADALGNVIIPKGVVAPYKSSDLAIVPMDRPIAAVLDTAAGWRRIAVTDSTAIYPKRSGLWVRESWWTHATRPGTDSLTATRPSP